MCTRKLPGTLKHAFADPFDIEVELERKELIALLDRAMSALPPETRTALAEIAAQLGMNAGAIAMRLQHGRLALRRVLTTRLQDEIASYLIRSRSWIFVALLRCFP